MTKKLFLTLTITALFFTNCATRQASVAEALTVVEALETTATHDYGVVINGIRWATRNVDAPGTFAPYPESSGMLFQWNRKKGWNAVDRYVEDWDFLGASGINVKWEKENDPCPTGWRVPTYEELQSLYNSGSIWTTQRRINGRLFGTAPYQIFLPVAGHRGINGVLFGASETALYWSNTLYHNHMKNAWGLTFEDDYAIVWHFYRVAGFSIRCIAIQ